MRSLLILFLAAFLLSTFRVDGVRGQIDERRHTVAIGSLDLAVEERGWVDLVVLEEPAPGFGAWTIDVTYDRAVVSVVACTARKNGTCQEGQTENVLRVFGADAEGLTGDVTVATITFQCERPGTSALSLEAIVAVASIPEIVDTVEVREGQVTCGAAAGLTGTATPAAGTPTSVVSLPATGTDRGSRSSAPSWLLAGLASMAFASVASMAAFVLRRRDTHG